MSSNYPFNGNAQTFQNDFAVNTLNPAVEYGGTEADALYYEDREINGAMYRVQNATWNKWAQLWMPINPALPCYGTVLLPSGMTQFINVAAGVSPFASSAWIVVASIDKSGNIVGNYTGTFTGPINSTTGAFSGALSAGSISTAGSVTATDFLGKLDATIDLSALGIFNVKFYGAKCDGVTDDTTAWENALSDAAVAGGEVLHPGGTSIVNAPLSVSSDVSVIGSGRGASVVKAGSTLGTQNLFFFSGSSYSSHAKYMALRDITLDGSGQTNFHGAFIALSFIQDADYTIIERVAFQNSPSFAIFNTSSNPSTQCEKNTVRDCVFSSTGNGIGQSFGTLQSGISPGSSVVLTMNAALPSGITGSNYSQICLEPGTTVEESCLITAVDYAANQVTVSSVQHTHAINAVVTGIRQDSLGGGYQNDSCYENNVFVGVYGNAIDNTATVGGRWAGNRVLSPATGVNTTVPGSITSDFGLNSSAIVGNYLQAGSIVVGDSAAGASNNLIADNVIIGVATFGYINLFTNNNSGTFGLNRGNIVRGNRLVNPGQNAINVADQHDFVVADNVIIDPSFAGGTQCSFVVLNAGTNASSGCFNNDIHGNHFIDDRGGTNTRYNVYDGTDGTSSSGNRVRGNTFFSGTGASLRNLSLTLAQNLGYNPVGAMTAPTVTTGTYTYTNTSGVDQTLNVSGGTVSAISANGVATGLTSGSFFVPVGKTLVITNTVIPTVTVSGN